MRRQQKVDVHWLAADGGGGPPAEGGGGPPAEGGCRLAAEDGAGSRKMGWWHKVEVGCW